MFLLASCSLVQLSPRSATMSEVLMSCIFSPLLKLASLVKLLVCLTSCPGRVSPVRAQQGLAAPPEMGSQAWYRGQQDQGLTSQALSHCLQAMWAGPPWGEQLGLAKSPDRQAGLWWWGKSKGTWVCKPGLGPASMRRVRLSRWSPGKSTAMTQVCSQVWSRPRGSMASTVGTKDGHTYSVALAGSEAQAWA